jgi:hypothetical protein
LRNDFNRETKAHNEVRRQVNLMRSALDAAKTGKMNPASQGVLVTFQKILDPTSVVRESEYARSPQGMALMEQMRGALTKMTEGGAGMTVDGLSQFYSVAEAFARESEQSYNEIKQQYVDQAADLGIKPERIARDWNSGGGKDAGGAGQAQPPPAKGPAIGERRLINGQVGVWDGQGWAPEGGR